MGLQETLIEKFATDFIKKLKPAEIVDALIKGLTKEIDLLKGDADGDGVVDQVEIERSLAIIAEEGAKIARVLEAVHSKKGK